MSKSHTKELLLAAILADPWVKDNYIKLIEHLRNVREETELESFRDMYSQRFLPGSDFWRMWLADVVQLKTEDHAHAFFARAFQQCPDIDLASDYITYIEKCVEDNDMTPSTFRKLIEPILCTVGTDLATGGEIWKRYRMIEVEEYEDVLETCTDPRSTDIIAAKTYIIQNVFTRQLGIPLLGNELVLQELETFLGEYCESSDVDIIKPDVIKASFDTSMEKRVKLIVFEEKLLVAAEGHDGIEQEVSTTSASVTTSIAATSALIRAWKEYIQYEMTPQQQSADIANPSRVQRLYERAIMALGQCTTLNMREIFDDYAEFACKLKDWRLLDAVTQRGTIVAYNDVSMWKLRLLAVELSGLGEEAFLLTHQLSLSSGFASPTDYLALILLKCDYYRRILCSVAGASSALTASIVVDIGPKVKQLREAFESAELFMSQYYPTWVDGWASILRYRVSIEDSLISDLADRLDAWCEENSASTPIELASCSPAVWEKFMSSFGETCGAVVWKEYMSWALVVTTDLNVCRQILRKAVASTAPDAAAQEALCMESIQFEERHGLSALSVVTAMSKAKPKLLNISQSRAAVALVDVVASNSKDSGEVKPTNLKAPKMDYIEKKNLKRSREEAVAQENNISKKPKGDFANKEAGKVDKEPTESMSGTNTGTDIAMEIDNVGGEVRQSKSIFIKNVAFATTEEEMVALCKTCGDVENYEFLTATSGKFKGMVQVNFKTPEEALNAVQTLNGHPINNRKLTVELFHTSTSGEGETGSSKHSKDGDSNDRFHPTTVFVSKLPVTYGDEDVKKYFEVFGAVKIARVLLDKRTGESKCRALVEFESSESIPRALECRHLIDGNKVSLARSKFPATAPASANAPNKKAIGAAPLAATTATKNSVSTLGFKPRVLKKPVFDMGPPNTTKK